MIEKKCLLHIFMYWYYWWYHSLVEIFIFPFDVDKIIFELSQNKLKMRLTVSRVDKIMKCVTWTPRLESKMKKKKQKKSVISYLSLYKKKLS